METASSIDKNNRPGSEKGIHFSKQQEFFREYQILCLTKPDFLQAQLDHWEKAKPTILTDSIEKQAESADYVTIKTCALGREHLLSYANEMLMELKVSINPFRQMNTCGIGNNAYILKKLLDFGEGNSELYRELLKTYNEYLHLCKATESQRNNAT